MIYSMSSMWMLYGTFISHSRKFSMIAYTYIGRWYIQWLIYIDSEIITTQY